MPAATRQRSLRCSSRLPWLLALVVAVALASCGSSDSGDNGDAVTVAVSTTIWGDVVSNVACTGDVAVQTLVPAGSDPHAFEPSLADRGVLEDASLVVINGLGLEEGLLDTVDAVARGGTTVFSVADHMETIGVFGVGGAQDPHIWFDPVRVIQVLDPLAAHLVEHAGLEAADLAECVKAYRAELIATDLAIAELVAGVPDTNRNLVTNHDALGYFANRYGFRIIGTVIPGSSTLADTNPAELESLAVLIEQAGVQAIFTESQDTSDTAAALADRVGDIEVVTLQAASLGDADSVQATYVDFLLENAKRVSSALS